MINQIKKAAGQTVASENTRLNYSGLAPLVTLRSNGAMPKAGLIWLGLGCRPPKRNALALDPQQLPTDEECKSVAGLDVIVCFYGHMIKYMSLHRLCGSLYAARPHRLQVFDWDYGRIAFLKLGDQ